MTSERLRHVTIALGVVIFLWGAMEIIRGEFDESGGDFTLASLEMSDVDSVLLERATDTLRFVKLGESEWSVNGNRANNSSVSDMFGVFAEPESGELIARSATTHGRLEIADSVARRFRAFGGGTAVYDVMLGKRAASFQHTYFRRPGEDEVFSVRTNLATYVDRRLTEWRDRSIVDIDPDSVASVEIQVGRRRYALQRGDDGWTVDGQPADSAAIQTMIRQYRAITGVDFPEPEQRDSIDFDSPDRRALLRDAAGATLAELVFDSMATGYWTRLVGDTTVMRVDANRVNRLTPADSTLRVEN